MGVQWKIQLLGGGSQKTNIEGMIAWKGQGGVLVHSLAIKGEGGLEREGGVFFLGGGGSWYPNAHFVKGFTLASLQVL